MLLNVVDLWTSITQITTCIVSVNDGIALSCKYKYNSLVTFTAEKALFDAVWLWNRVQIKYPVFLGDWDGYSFPLFIVLITQYKASLWEENLH